MAIISHVRFAHEDGALAPTFSRLPPLHATVVREASTDPNQRVYLIRFEYDDSPGLRSVLDEDHTVRHVELMRGFEDRKLWAIEFEPEARLLNPKVTSEDGLVLDARSSNDQSVPRGWLERWLLPDRESLHTIWQHAREEGFEFEVLEFRRQAQSATDFTEPALLTDEQREALLVAYENGYFAEPRETSLAELGAELGLSPTAVGGRLKRGMKSLLGMTIVVEQSTK